MLHRINTVQTMARGTVMNFFGFGPDGPSNESAMFDMAYYPFLPNSIRIHGIRMTAIDSNMTVEAVSDWPRLAVKF
jgi:hypothetical protein